MFTPNEKDTTSDNAGFKHMFKSAKLTLGLMSPIETYPHDMPSMLKQEQRVLSAESAGFSAIWVKDIPLRDSHQGDIGQVYDSFTYLAWLAAKTERISLVAGSIALPLRHPIHTAKQAASIDQLSSNRFIMGLSSGDRSIDFPAFGQKIQRRGEIFRESFQTIQSLLRHNFPEINNQFGHIHSADLVPKPQTPLPMFVTDTSTQNMQWITQNSDGWITTPHSLTQQIEMARYWHSLCQQLPNAPFKPFVQSMNIDLSDNPNQSPQDIPLGYHLGRNELRSMLDKLCQAGVNHITFNLKLSARPIDDILQELEEFITPHFLPHTQG